MADEGKPDDSPASAHGGSITHSEILDLIVQNASLPDILQVIASMTERQIPGALASILLLDEDGLRVHVGAGPSLPREFNAAIEGASVCICL